MAEDRWIPAVIRGVDPGKRIEVAQAALRGYVEGDEVVIRIRKPRNPRHHRLYWALLRAVVEATGLKWPNERLLHNWLLIQTGRYTASEIINGRLTIELDSIDFMAMDQAEFADFYDLAVECIALETGLDPERLLRK